MAKTQIDMVQKADDFEGWFGANLHLAKRGEAVDPVMIRRRTVTIVAVVVAGLTLFTVDMILLVQGSFVEAITRRLAVFVAILMGGVCAVGLMALVSLFMSALAYEHMRALRAEDEVIEAVKEAEKRMEEAESTISAGREVLRRRPNGSLILEEWVAEAKTRAHNRTMLELLEVGDRRP